MSQNILDNFLAPALLAEPGALEVVSVSQSVSAYQIFFCLNDQAYNCLIHLRDNCTVTVRTQTVCIKQLGR